MLFEYRGVAALTVVGPVTGARYHFDRHGARVPVALPDRDGLTRVPRLHQVG